MSLLAELRRRNVFRVGIFYAVAGWILLQVGDLLFGALGVPPWGLRLLLGLLVLGFPLALVFAWAYELTPEGLKREHEVDRNASITARTGTKLNVLIAVLLVIAIGLMLADRFLAHGPVTAESNAPSVATMPTATTTTTTSLVSIAVLPFVNMSDDKSNEYFSDGLTEELLNVLANVEGLRVIARTSSFAYKGKDVKIADVARDLDVDNVLEGSVRKAGNRVRITSQLIRASDSSHLWSETYDRDLDDIFAVQDEISGHVVDALKVRLLPGQGSAPDPGGTNVAAAYEAYLRGRFLRNQGEAEATLRAALAAFDEAIALDPAYARAHVGRADALGVLASNAYEPFDTGFARAREAAERAIELAPDLAEAYRALGFLLLAVEGDVQGAAAASKRALQLNPGSYDVQYGYAIFASSLGRHEVAIAAAKKAVDLDPIAPGAHINLASALWNARRYPGAEAAARRAIALAPERPAGHATLGAALLMQKRYDEALAEFEKESVDWQRMTGRALVFAMTGQADLAHEELAAMRTKFAEAASYQYAMINAQLGDLDEAFRELADARRVRDPGLMSNILVDPTLDPLRKVPRFDVLLRDLGLGQST
jgi:TolB-like protein/tetratricopeptide (TPR) repeat protein